MWAAWIVAAIALAGAAFMLRFLIALLEKVRRRFATGSCQCARSRRKRDTLEFCAASTSMTIAARQKAAAATTAWN